MSNAHHVGVSGPTRGDRLARTLALAVAATFLVVGVLGFIPGITTDYDDHVVRRAPLRGEAARMFQVSVLHNIVHLLFGLVGLALARSRLDGGHYLVGGGVVYLVLWIYGLVDRSGQSANFVPVNRLTTGFT